MNAIMKMIFSFILVIALSISDVYGYEVCDRNLLTYTYCEDGYYCCDNNTQCCPDATLAVGVIIAIVIGSILFISCVIAVICCAVKKSHRPGQIIQPAQQPGVAIISTGQQAHPGYGQPMYNQPMYGQQPGQPVHGFQQQTSGDKAGTSDPAYPPPPPPNY